MNTNFSFHRIGLLLRRDWIEHRIKLGYFMATLIALLLFFSFPDNGIELIVKRQHGFLCLGLLACYGFFLSFTGKKIHHSQGIFLTLPASSLEKFLSILIIEFVILLTFVVLYWAGIFGISLCIPDYPVIGISAIMGNISNYQISSLNITGFFAFVSSLVFLSYVTFPKHAFAYSVCGLLLLTGLVAGSTYLILDMYDVSNLFAMRYNTYAHEYPFLATGKILSVAFAPVIYVASAVVMYVAYLKLKEKELR